MWVFGGVPHQLLPVEQASSVLVEISEQSPPSGRVAACGGQWCKGRVQTRLGGGALLSLLADSGQRSRGAPSAVPAPNAHPPLQWRGKPSQRLRSHTLHSCCSSHLCERYCLEQSAGCGVA